MAVNVAIRTVGASTVAARQSQCHAQMVAEREGFEPSMGCPIPHFQCGALGL